MSEELLAFRIYLREEIPLIPVGPSFMVVDTGYMESRIFLGEIPEHEKKWMIPAISNTHEVYVFGLGIDLLEIF